MRLGLDQLEQCPIHVTTANNSSSLIAAAGVSLLSKVGGESGSDLLYEEVSVNGFLVGRAYARVELIEKLNILEWRNGGKLLKLDTKALLEGICNNFVCSIMQQLELFPQSI